MNKKFFIILLSILAIVSVPFFTKGASGNIENPLKFDNIGALIDYIATFLIILALPIATIMITYAAFLLITAGGSEEKVKKAKQVIIYAIVGIAVLLVAKGAALVLKDILGAGSTQSPPASSMIDKI